MTRFLAALVVALGLLAVSLPSQAQTLPEYENLYVNDYADMLSPEIQETLRRKLNYLREDIGTEMSILTVTDMASYGDRTDIADFATAVFNKWGIGKAERNDGLLLVISKNDRTFSIEVGSGYPPIYDDISEDIIQFYITPAFKDGDFDDGVLDGADKMISLIALPFNGGELSPERPKNPNDIADLIFWGMAIFFGGSVVAAVLGPKLSGFQFARKPCPQCGQKGMVRKTTTLQSATTSDTGLRETNITCPNCSYFNVTQFIIPRVSDTDDNNSSGSGGSSFGGGSSSGGGASGKW
ncbi:TPM domain-containing protein [Falsihalocynthiibacter sp. S25ZX9]|uniref:TPM domain-containing protein n=1 Tax=Falsihalocynthiibacter sp. S25ZX9 TaxID=3240870 RepID=UPI00350F1D62